jgi:hypothetical protein
MKKDTAKRKADRIVIMVFLALFALASIVWFIDPTGNLFRTVIAYSVVAIIGGLGLVCLYGLFLVLRLVWARGLSISGLSISGNIDDPNLFNEMQFTLGGILRPLDFTLATQDHQGQKYADFTKDEFRVSLSWEDKICWLYLLDKSNVSDDKKTRKPDLTVKCSNVRKAEEFKNESIVKLNEWLIEKKLK